MSPVVLRTDDGTWWCGEELSARGGGLSMQAVVRKQEVGICGGVENFMHHSSYI